MSWETKSLNNIITFQRGFDLPKSKFKDGVYPVVGSTGVIGYHNEFKVCAPGVVTGRSGTLGVFQYFEEDFWAHNTSLWVKDFQENNPKFIYYFLHQFDFKSLNGGVAVPTLNRNILSSINVKYPKSLKTQKRIADILSAYDDLIENNLKRIKLLEQAAQNIYKEWFVNLRFPGYENTPVNEETGLPVGWEDLSFGDSLTFKTGKLNSNAAVVGGEYPFFTCSQEIFRTNTFSFDTEAVLLGGNNASANYPLKYFKGKFDAYQRTYIIKPKCHISHKYIYLVLLDRLYFLKQISTGAATKFLTMKILNQLRILIPSIEISVHFERIVSPFFEQIALVNNQNQKLKAARDILLPRLMNRTIEV